MEIVEQVLTVSPAHFTRFSRNAARLIKENIDGIQPPFDFEGETLRLTAAMETLFTDIFTQLFRNSMDHGAQGRGTVMITIRKRMVGQNFVLEVKDNGPGLDLKKLATFDTKADQSDEEIARNIFRTGVSRAGTVTEVSGRGVGMDIVHEQVLQFGGRVDVVFLSPRQTSGRRAFKVVFSFPGSCVLQGETAAMKIA